MVCTQNHSKIFINLLLVICVSTYVIFICTVEVCLGAFASKFSLSVGEQYTDNVFFSKSKEHDFITVISPTLTFLYAPQGEPLPTLNLTITPSAQIFARHDELNNFGKNLSADAGYTARFGPRFSLFVSDRLARAGDSRTGDFSGSGLLGTQTSLPALGTSTPLSSSLNLKDFVSRGDQVINQFSLTGNFLYRPDINIRGEYINAYTNFIDQGGSEVRNRFGARGVYNWRQEHNLHAGYFVDIVNSRNGEDSVIHNFDIGDDYFSNLQVRLSPTLTLAVSTGVSLNLGSEGPGIANNTNITLTKIWETAMLNAGMRKGLTPSFGIAGISDTTSLFSNFNLRLTERLSASTGVDFSFYDTDDVNFKTFQATVGVQYQLNRWLSSNFWYGYRWVDGGSGGETSDLLNKGIVRANTAFVSLTAHFDVWPTPGLARAIGISPLTPIVTPPFTTSTPPPVNP
jgi:hypothetical protein